MPLSRLENWEGRPSGNHRYYYWKFGSSRLIAISACGCQPHCWPPQMLTIVVQTVCPSSFARDHHALKKICILPVLRLHRSLFLDIHERRSNPRSIYKGRITPERSSSRNHSLIPITRITTHDIKCSEHHMKTQTLHGDQPQPIDQLLTLDQAAAQLAVSRRTLYRMMAAKEFPRPIRVGGSRRVSQIELVQFLESAKQRRA